MSGPSGKLLECSGQLSQRLSQLSGPFGQPAPRPKPPVKSLPKPKKRAKQLSEPPKPPWTTGTKRRRAAVVQDAARCQSRMAGAERFGVLQPAGALVGVGAKRLATGAPSARHRCRIGIKTGSSSVGAASAGEYAAPTELGKWGRGSATNMPRLAALKTPRLILG